MVDELMDRYRCLEMLAGHELLGQLSKDAGYFQVGSGITCFGRSAVGHRARNASSPLYDVSHDVAVDHSPILLPFDPSEILDNLRSERYAVQFDGRAWGRAVKNLYYMVRPLMPVSVRKHFQRAFQHGWGKTTFPRWPVDTTVDDLHEKLLLWSMKAQGIDRLPFVWFWPDGAESCVIMTHDVEDTTGYRYCNELMALDDAFGLKASLQLVPEGSYAISPQSLQDIRERGFEINVQDLNHDGHLFRNRNEFVRRAQKINRYGRLYGARGFRAAVLYRNQNWYHALDFSYDLSVPNVAHLDPQRGGCCTVMPYFIGDILEIPLTTTQDYMLFHLLKDYSLDLWKAQTRAILKKNGLISFLVHPDYVIEERANNVYRDLLGFIRQMGEEEHLWFALPRDVDAWWRARSKMRVVEHAGDWRIEGVGTERAVLAFAIDAGDHLEYEIPSESRFAADRKTAPQPFQPNVWQ